MSQENNAEDIFQSIKDGLQSFGKTVGDFVEEVIQGDGIKSSGDVRVRTDIYQSGDFFVIELELPGMSKKEVSIQIYDGTLQVKGTKKAVEGSESFVYQNSERQFGPFLKTFELPTDVELENIKAKYEAGVLTIRFPRPMPEVEAEVTEEAAEDSTSINID
ncbi:MAG: Hsp20/alpha crystallin family protein [Bacteroidota bacterium]